MSFGTLKGTLVGGATSVTNPLNASGSVSVTAGDLIVAVYAELTSDTVTGITDNLGNTYTPQNAGSAATAAGRAFWSIAAFSGTLTTVSAATTASSDDAAIVVGVFDQGPNGFAASPLDASPANTTGDVSSPFACPATGTLAQASELVVAWMSLTRGQTNTAATSPNLLAANQASSTANAANSICAALGYHTVAATTSVAPAFTCASGTFNGSVLGTMSFKEAAAAAPFRQGDWPNPDAGLANARNGLVLNREWSFQGNSLYLGQGVVPPDTTHILRSPLVTKIEPKDPTVSIRAGLENRPNLQTSTLVGKDTRAVGATSTDLPNRARQPTVLDTPNLLTTTLGVVAPFAQRDWPVPKGGPAQTPAQHPNQLTGTLAGQGARVVGQSAAEPNPISKPPAVELRTHVQPLNLLAGRDVMAPGSAAIAPNPIKAQPPQLFDPPNLLGTTLASSPADTTHILRAALIIRIERSNADAAIRSGGFSNVALLSPIQPPFVQSDWPLPLRSAGAVPSQHPNLLTSGLAAQGVAPVGQAAAAPNPRGAAQPIITDPPNLFAAGLKDAPTIGAAALDPPPVRKNQPVTFDPFNLLETTLGTTAPFRQAEWQNPRVTVSPTHATPALDLLNTTLAGQGPTPFAQTDWPVPKGAVPVVTLRENIPQQTIYVPAPAFEFRAPTQYKYEKSSWRDALNALSLGTNLELFGGSQPPPTPPPNCYDWPNPKGAPYPIALRTFVNPLSLELRGQDTMFGDPGQVPTYLTAQPRDAGDYQLEINQPSPLSLISTGSLLTITMRFGAEILGRSAADLMVPFEFLASGKADTQVGIEYQASVRGDSGAAVEFRASQQGDFGTPSEFSTLQKVDTTIASESLVTVRVDSVASIEELASQRSDPVVAAESSGTVLVVGNLISPIEFASILRLDFGNPTEAVSSQKVDVTAPVEMLLSVRGDAILGIEDLFRVLSDILVPAEVQASVRADQNIPAASLASQRTDFPLPSEWNAGFVVVGNLIIPFESSGSVHSTTKLLAESVSTVTALLTDTSVPIEFLAGVHGDLELVLEAKFRQTNPKRLLVSPGKVRIIASPGKTRLIVSPGKRRLLKS